MAKKRHNMTKDELIANKQKSILRDKINNTIPHIYAGLCITLKEYCGFDKQQIVDCLSASQKIWEDCAEKHLNLIEWCKESTGIDCMGLTDYEKININTNEDIVFMNAGDNPYQE